MSARTIDDAVGNQFDRLEGASFGTDITRVDDVIAPDSDSRAVFVLFVGFEFSYNLGLGDFFAEVCGYIPVPYNVEGVVAFNTLR